METKENVDVLTRDDPRITTSEQCVAIGIENLPVMAIIRELSTESLRKMGAEMLIVKHKTARKKHLCRTPPAQ
jgi:hypothetical protein